MESPIIPVLSLLIALLAVLVSPIVSWFVAKRSVESSERVSARQLIAPMREAWLDHLRSLMADFSAATLHYFVAGFEERTDDEYFRMTRVQEEIRLMLGPNNDLHVALEQAMYDTLRTLEAGRKAQAAFEASHTRFGSCARGILKEVWDDIEQPERLAPNKTAQRAGASQR